MIILRKTKAIMINDMECLRCETEFEITYDDSEIEINYCPFCGETIIHELEFDND